jgi:hypothetical protein
LRHIPDWLPGANNGTVASIVVALLLEGNMKNRSKAFAEASPLIDGMTSRPRSENSDPATERLTAEALSSCEEEWTILRTSPVNALIVGTLHLTEAAVAGIDTSLRQPIVWWDSSLAPEPPELTAGTLVIRDVDRLDAQQQERLLGWMCLRRPAVQVLALARTPLIARVVDGRFAPELYYRLNTVLVEVRAQADLPSS